MPLTFDRAPFGFQQVCPFKEQLYSSNHLINHFNMLSNRGEVYAEAGLANAYLGPPKTPFDKENKEGVVSFGNAENVKQ